jgi:hypothetical protein
MNCRKFGGLLIYVLLACVAKAQETRYIDLKDLESPQRLLHYKITGVTDNRPDTASMGDLQLGFLTRKTYHIQLKGGVSASLKAYISTNFRQDAAATPIELGIMALSVREITPGLRTEIGVKLTIAFFMNGQRLTEYTGNASAKTMGDLLLQVKDLISQNLQSCLLAFDDWWNQYKNLYLPNAPVPVEVVINTTPDTTRLINYSRNRPLAINDFRAKPSPGDKAIAITASNMIIKYSVITDSDHLKMMVTITTYFDRSRSWFKHTEFDDMVLLHEQGHFDIAAIKACELADTLRHCTFTRSNCYEMIEKIQSQKQLELRALQELYDEKTGHGAGIGVQQKWSRDLKELIARQTCYP